MSFPYKKFFNLFSVVGLLSLSLTGCVQLPAASYTPQNFGGNIKYDGKANIGKFTYVPFERGEVKSNQIENRGLGQILIEGDIAELVQRGTTIELERTGIKLGDAKYTIIGRIKTFHNDHIGFNARWSYLINYQILNSKTSAIELDKDYYADPKTISKFSATIGSLIKDINELIYSAYHKFISDPQTRKLLSEQNK